MLNAEDKYIPGTPCIINKSSNMYMFHDVPCVVVKRTKSGLIMVALANDANHTYTYSFPQRNVDLIKIIPQG